MDWSTTGMSRCRQLRYQYAVSPHRRCFRIIGHPYSTCWPINIAEARRGKRNGGLNPVNEIVSQPPEVNNTLVFRSSTLGSTEFSREFAGEISPTGHHSDLFRFLQLRAPIPHSRKRIPGGDVTEMRSENRLRVSPERENSTVPTGLPGNVCFKSIQCVPDRIFINGRMISQVRVQRRLYLL